LKSSLKIGSKYESKNGAFLAPACASLLIGVVLAPILYNDGLSERLLDALDLISEGHSM
jgi:hypothetical protein